MTKRIYRRGPRITDPHLLLSMLIDGRVVYCNHKPQNAAWLISMQLGTLIQSCRRGVLYEAIRIEPENGNE